MKKNLLHLIPCLLISAFILSGCLKDELHEEGKTLFVPENSNIIELAGTPSGVATCNSANGFVLESSPNDTSFNLVAVRLANSEPASEDIKVTLEVDQALLAAYNTATNSKYQVPPSSIYTFPGLVVTIPKGAREGYLVMKTNSQNIAAGTYGFAFRIKSVEPSGYRISGNFNNQIIRLNAKNPYDGMYKVTGGKVQRYTAPGAPETTGNLNGPLAGNQDVTLTTIDANTVEITGLQWAKGSGSGVAGIDNLRATVDPVTNLVAMKSLGNATLANWSGKENKYDPVNKTFYLAFDWNQTANRREYEIVLKYDRPRP